MHFEVDSKDSLEARKALHRVEVSLFGGDSTFFIDACAHGIKYTDENSYKC